MRLRSHLTVLALLTLLPLSIFACVVGYFLVEQQRETLIRTVQERARALASAVDAELNGSIKTLEALAAVESLKHLDLKYFRRTTANILSTQANWVNINVALPDRRRLFDLLAADGAALPPITDDGEIAELLRTRRPVVSGIASGPISKRWNFAARVPVVLDGEVRYILSAVIQPDSISRLVEAQNLPPGWVAAVLDQNDRIVARTVEPEKSRGRLASEPVREALARSPSGWVRTSTREGLDAYVPYHRSPYSGWAFVIGIPASAVHSAAWNAVALLGFGLFAAGALALWLAHVFGKRIAHPVAGLAAATDAMGGGGEVEFRDPGHIEEILKLHDALRRAHGAIREREERFRVMADAAPVMVWMSGTDKLCTWFNKAWLEFVGRPMEQELGNGWTENVHADDFERCLQIYSSAFDARQPFSMEYRLRRYDGEYRWLRDDGIPRFEAKGTFAGYIGACMDITDFKHAEQGLRESEQRFRIALGHTPILVYRTDCDLRYQWMFNNPGRFAKLDVIGKRDDELLPHESVAELIDLKRRVLASGVRERREIKIVIDGRGEHWDVNAEPFRDDSGAIVGLIVSAMDITERKRAEEALREAEEHRRSVVDHVVDGIITIDESGAIQTFNPAAERIFGYLAPEVIGQNVKMLMPDPYRREHDGYIANYIGTGQPKIIGIGREVEGLRKDGSTFPLDLAVSVFHLRARRYFTGVVRDITERKRAELARKDADRAKDEFLAMLSHELRNPLAALTSSAHVLKVVPPSSADAIKARGVVERQTRHMTRLISDLLDINRVALGKLSLQRERFNAAEAVLGVINVWRATGRLAAHMVSPSLQPVWVEGDRVRIEQIASNLLDNAIKFTPAGKKITVSLRREDGEAVLRVADEGIGLAPENCSRIFDLFVQGEFSPRAGGGLGIGLALVKRLAELHGGSVSAASEGRGRGIEFTVRLPAIDQPAVQAKTPSLDVASGRSILIVEDNDDARQMLQAILSFDGHQVRAARDGNTGLALAAEKSPDLALIDIALPDMDGYEVARRLRMSKGERRIHLIAISGFGQARDQGRAYEAGFDAYLVKPVVPERLKQAIAGLP